MEHNPVKCRLRDLHLLHLLLRHLRSIWKFSAPINLKMRQITLRRYF